MLTSLSQASHRSIDSNRIHFNLAASQPQAVLPSVQPSMWSTASSPVLLLPFRKVSQYTAGRRGLVSTRFGR